MQPRLANLDDELRINHCILIAFEEYVERMGKKPEPIITDYKEHIINKCVYVLEQKDNSIIGVIVLIPREDHMYLDMLAIHPNEQGKGFGKKLIKFGEQVSLKLKLNEMRLCTNVHMYDNHKIYNKLGFKEVERKTVNGYDRIYYKKILNAEQIAAPDRKQLL